MQQISEKYFDKRLPRKLKKKIKRLGGFLVKIKFNKPRVVKIEFIKRTPPWIEFDYNDLKKQPDPIVKEYETKDSNGCITILEWYSGDCFQWCIDGHWSGEGGEQVLNITHYREIINHGN